jgi:hypothetical protein
MGYIKCAKLVIFLVKIVLDQIEISVLLVLATLSIIGLLRRMTIIKR